MREEFKETLDAYRVQFDEALGEYCKDWQIKPAVLGESIRYSLAAGGKRLRPVLMFAVAKMLGGRLQDVSGFAVALEMIHTYSLIHDDLPAMDDDDFRRGQPSNHKKFGEGQAILAGDALLNEAYSVCFEESKKGRTYLNAACVLCANAGASGMVAGQSADLFYQGKEAGRAEAEFIILNKTAKMIMSAVSIPAYVYGADENIIAILTEFGKNFGFLFQITDDLLDVTGDFEKLGKTVGKDKVENKISAVRLLGEEKARERAEHYAQICCKLLNELPYESEFLQELTAYVLSRKS